jgi:hypothetical protein
MIIIYVHDQMQNHREHTYGILKKHGKKIMFYYPDMIFNLLSFREVRTIEIKKNIHNLSNYQYTLKLSVNYINVLSIKAYEYSQMNDHYQSVYKYEEVPY